MSTASSSTVAKLERAKKCTSLTTSQVMQLAGFSLEECSNLSTKKASQIGITVLGGEQPVISPLTNPMPDASSSVSPPKKKELKNQLNS